MHWIARPRFSQGEVGFWCAFEITILAKSHMLARTWNCRPTVVRCLFHLRSTMSKTSACFLISSIGSGWSKRFAVLVRCQNQYPARRKQYPLNLALLALDLTNDPNTVRNQGVAPKLKKTHLLWRSRFFSFHRRRGGWWPAGARIHAGLKHKATSIIGKAEAKINEARERVDTVLES